MIVNLNETQKSLFYELTDVFCMYVLYEYLFEILNCSHSRANLSSLPFTHICVLDLKRNVHSMFMWEPKCVFVWKCQCSTSASANTAPPHPPPFFLAISCKSHTFINCTVLMTSCINDLLIIAQY